jgi:hypothetical protein
MTLTKINGVMDHEPDNAHLFPLRIFRSIGLVPSKDPSYKWEFGPVGWNIWLYLPNCAWLLGV